MTRHRVALADAACPCCGQTYISAPDDVRACADCLDRACDPDACPTCGSLSPWRCGCLEETDRNDTGD